jgi:hypothetical protein
MQKLNGLTKLILAFVAFIVVVIIFKLFPTEKDAFNELEKYPTIERCNEFLEKYPNGEYAGEVRTVLDNLVAEQEIEDTYGNNSLQNGSQPYANWYGSNKYYGTASVRVNAPSNSDVVVIVKNNYDGSVAGHVYVEAGRTASVPLLGKHNYQVFFYYGRGWYPEKEMGKGTQGGFLHDESFSKDGTPFFLNDYEEMSYTLQLTKNGNFSTSHSNENEMF